jgi:hypothetical protein
LRPGVDFSYIFFWGKFWGKFRGKFSPKNVGKNGIFRGKSFEKSFFQKIPWNFPRKVIFRGKKCTKNRPLGSLVELRPSLARAQLYVLKTLYGVCFAL